MIITCGIIIVLLDIVKKQGNHSISGKVYTGDPSYLHTFIHPLNATHDTVIRTLEVV